MRTPDILAELGRDEANGQAGAGWIRRRERRSRGARPEKLQRKHVDFIVANDISRADAGFEVDTNAVTIVSHDSEETIAHIEDGGGRRVSSIARSCRSRLKAQGSSA